MNRDDPLAADRQTAQKLLHINMLKTDNHIGQSPHFL